METSLHRALKSLYAGKDAQFEVTLGEYRIDVIADGVLVEIQHGSLSAIRDKIKKLLRKHHVLVVKPIVARKTLVKRIAKDGEVLQRRLSPKRGKLLDIFDELVHFTQVFPHKRLTLDLALVDIEEWRYPGHGRRRRWRASDHQVEDQRLLAVHSVHRLQTAADLLKLIDCPLPTPFHTGHLAKSLCVRRWIAQRIAYCLRKMGAVSEMGKEGNARLYQFNTQKPKASPKKKTSRRTPLRSATNSSPSS